MFNKLKPKSDFTKNVLTLMTGTTIAQAIPIAISPILTRLYTPEDFGVFALYMSFVSFLGVFATFRYEMAIMLPKSYKVVKILMNIIMKISLSYMIFLIFLVLFFNKTISEVFNNELLYYWLYFLPFSIFISGVYKSFNYLLIREKLFKILAKNKVIISITMVLVQLVFGFFDVSIGLLIGYLAGYISAIYFILKLKKIFVYLKLKANKQEMKEIALRYKKFPLFDVPSVFVNISANQVPIMSFGKFFNIEMVGYFSLMQKTLMSPISLIANSVLNVFKQRATEDFNKYGNCINIYVKTFKSLFLLGIIPFTILGLYGPEIFQFVFGKDWVKAGEFAQILAPMFFLNFVVSPLTYVLFIREKQHINLIGQIILLGLVIISIFLGVKLHNEYLAIKLYGISYSLIYIAYLIYSYKLAKG